MLAVRFVKHFGCYEKGNIAGFPDDEAHRLVDSKVAEFLDKKPPKKHVTDDMVKK